MIFNCSIAAKSAKCTYNWTTLCIFHIYGGHFEYFKSLKGGNMPPTWNCSMGCYILIIKERKTLSFNLTLPLLLPDYLYMAGFAVKSFARQI